jgi:membrane-associated phospholipid phosphatase
VRSGSSAKLEASSSVAAPPPATEPLISPLAQELETDKRNALAALAVFLAAYAIALVPNAFDLPFERLINSYANKSVVIDHLFFDLDTYFIFSGVPVLALIWGEWSADKERRARLILGIFAVLCAGLLSRSLQHFLATHPRPFYDPALGFHLPSILSETPLATWNSFPSDHAAVFFGLAALIASVRPRLGLLVFLWLAVVDSARAYVGAHYPSDLIGGAALGASLVWLAQVPGVMRRVAGKIAGWERLSPALFYTAAFLLSYQVATLFADIRYLSGGFALIGNLRHLL